MPANKIEKLSFESAVVRLEEIITMLEDSNIDLETAIKLYTEGGELQKHCEKKLNEAQFKIEAIMKNNENKVIDKI